MPRIRNYDFVQYHQVILESDPIAYWIQDEKQGTVSYDWVRRRQGGDQDGAYTGTTPGQPGMGNGRTSQFFDGINDFNDIFTPTFQGRFNGSEGTVVTWVRVNGPGVWIDGAFRGIINLQVDGNNQILLDKTNANVLRWRYAAGGVVETVVLAVIPLDFFRVALTWSASAGATGEMRTFYNGVQTGGTQIGLGIWAGNLAVNTTVIGAVNTGPFRVWHGYIEHSAEWDRPLSPNEINAHYRAAAYVPR